MIMDNKHETKKERMDAASLLISAASLGVGIAALCLNEKGENAKTGETNMANRIDSTKYTNRKDLKKAYAKEIKRAAVSEIGYTGTVIVLNEKGKEVRYGLIPLENKMPARSAAKPKAKPKTQSSKKSWVAMEMNRRTGSDRQAIVCSSMNQARSKAQSMKNAHRSGSQTCKDCVQGYAYIDTSKSIDVKKAVANKDRFHRV